MSERSWIITQTTSGPVEVVLDDSANIVIRFPTPTTDFTVTDVDRLTALLRDVRILRNAEQEVGHPWPNSVVGRLERAAWPRQEGVDLDGGCEDRGCSTCYVQGPT